MAKNQNKMDQFTASSGEIIELRQVIDEQRAAYLRIKIIDGAKFHHIDLDPGTAVSLAESINLWAEQVR